MIKYSWTILQIGDSYTCEFQDIYGNPSIFIYNRFSTVNPGEREKNRKVCVWKEKRKMEKKKEGREETMHAHIYIYIYI